MLRKRGLALFSYGYAPPRRRLSRRWRRFVSPKRFAPAECVFCFAKCAAKFLAFPPPAQCAGKFMELPDHTQNMVLRMRYTGGSIS